ncbi:PAS domain-containing protein [Derxia gummosa]|uniref:PAS domain-containing protein n=1 Tax=Derxia gummosa DSM 723 TaxID=1121388 RepID=A0A8B6X906_9BURK|nr:PAS domain-containing protein [Derxia gummosa]
MDSGGRDHARRSGLGNNAGPAFTDPTMRPPARIPLATWLVAAVLCTVLGAVIATTLLVESFARAHAERSAGALLGQIARDMRNALDRGMEQQLEAVRLVATLDPVRAAREPATIRRVLEQFQDGYPTAAWLGLADTRGNVVAATRGMLEGRDVSRRPWFIGARDGAYAGDVHPAVMLEKLLPQQPEPWRFVDLAVPVSTPDGRATGVLGLHLSWGWARQLRDELLAALDAGGGVQVWVIDREGVVILGPAGAEGQRLPPEQYAGSWRGIDGFLVEDMGEDRRYTAVAQSAGRGRFESLGWRVLVRQPESVALAGFRELRTQIMATGVALALLFGAVAAALAWRLSRPFGQLADALDGRPGDAETALRRFGGFREAQRLTAALERVLARQRDHEAGLRADYASLERVVVERESELRVANSDLLETRQRLTEITDNLPVLVFYLDRDCRLRSANNTLRDYTGLTPAEATGRRYAEVFGEDAWRERRPVLERCLAGERMQVRVRQMRNGLAREYDAVFVPHRDDGDTVTGLYALVTDVTMTSLGRGGDAGVGPGGGNVGDGAAVTGGGTGTNAADAPDRIAADRSQIQPAP